MEALFATTLLLFNTYMLTWIGFSVLLIVALLSEIFSYKNFSIFVALISGFVIFRLTNMELSWGAVLGFIVLYLLVGIGWSIWRYKVFAITEIKLLKEREASIRSYHKYISFTDIAPDKHIGKIARWILVWPLSVMTHAITDINRLANLFITNVLIGFYKSIFEQELDKYKTENTEQPVETNK